MFDAGGFIHAWLHRLFRLCTSLRSHPDDVMRGDVFATNARKMRRVKSFVEAGTNEATTPWVGFATLRLNSSAQVCIYVSTFGCTERTYFQSTHIFFTPSVPPSSVYFPPILSLRHSSTIFYVILPFSMTSQDLFHM